MSQLELMAAQVVQNHAGVTGRRNYGALLLHRRLRELFLCSPCNDSLGGDRADRCQRGRKR
jgi:hypothetical protein